MTLLPGSVIESLHTHLQEVKLIHEQDLAEGHGAVQMPDALARKYPVSPAPPATAHYPPRLRRIAP